MNDNHKKIFKIILASCIIGFMGLSSVFADDLKLRSSINSVTPEIQLKGGVKIDKNNQTVNLSLRDSDIRQVLRMLADKSGYNIVMHESIKGTVTVDLLKTPLNKAFEYILTINQLAYWQDGNTIIIASNEEVNKLGLNKSQIKPIKIKYLDAGVVATFMNKNIFSINKPGGSSNPNVIINPNTNDIIVFGNEEDVALAQKVVNYLDVKPETKIFEVNYAKTSDIANIVCNSIFGVTATVTVPTAGTAINEENKIACSANTTLITADKLESLNTKGFQVYYNDSLHRLIIYGGTQEQILQIADAVKKFDKKQQQVYIELSIVELSESGSKALSSAWGYSNGRIAIDGGYSALSQGTAWDGTTGTPFSQTGEVIDPNTLQTITTTLIPGGHVWGGSKPSVLNYLVSNPNYVEVKDALGNITNADEKYITVNSGRDLIPSYAKGLTQFISVLVTQSKGRLLANPRIIATNNQKSTVDITSEYLDNRTQTTALTATNQPLTTTTYTKASAGIKIDITPKISPNGYINLDLNPSYTQPAEQLKEGTNIVLTFLNTRKLELTDIRVKDGESLVIGGLMQERETNSQQKIPILADLPLIGMFFKSSSTDKSRSELIIMVTPKIVKDNDSVETL
ncbi:MAG: hypothetical protein PHC34_11540 [Candidatus Gastranaerophilales bacterium]|nr:hypothetical protein [Candidatus Gastranaerophilales bacterium]